MRHDQSAVAADLLDKLSGHLGANSEDPCLATIHSTQALPAGSDSHPQIILSSAQFVPPDSNRGALRKFARSLMRRIDRIPLKAERASIEIQPAERSPITEINSSLGIDISRLNEIRATIPQKISINPDKQTLLSISLGSERWNFLTLHLRRRPIDPDATAALREELKQIGVFLRLVIASTGIEERGAGQASSGKNAITVNRSHTQRSSHASAIPELQHGQITDCSSLPFISADSGGTKRPEDMQYIEPPLDTTGAICSLICMPIGADRPAALHPGASKLCLSLSTRLESDDSITKRQVGLINATNKYAFTRWPTEDLFFGSGVDDHNDRPQHNIANDNHHVKQFYLMRDLALRLLPRHGPSATGTRMRLDPISAGLPDADQRLSIGIIVETLLDFASANILRWRDNLYVDGRQRPTVIVSRPIWRETPALAEIMRATNTSPSNLPTPAERDVISQMLLDAGRDDLVPKLNKAILDALCNRERVVLTPGDISRRGDRIRIKANSLIGKINNHNIASTLLNIEGIGVASLEPMIKLVSGARHFDLETVPGLKEDLDNAEANLRRELSRAHARLCSEGITD